MVTELNSELAKVQSLMTANQLTINVIKAEMLLISNRNESDLFHQIAINGHSVGYTDSCEFLVVILYNNLTFNRHVNHVVYIYYVCIQSSEAYTPVCIYICFYIYIYIYILT